MSEILQPPAGIYRDLDDESLSSEQIHSLIDEALILEDIRRTDKSHRHTVIIDGIIHALNIAPRLNDVLVNNEIPIGKEADVERAIEIDVIMQNAKEFIDHQQQIMNRVEFGDMMMDILDEVETDHKDSNLYRTLQYMRNTIPDMYRDELIRAHRLLLVVLHDTTR